MLQAMLLIVAAVIAAPLIYAATKPDFSQSFAAHCPVGKDFEAGLANLKSLAEKP